MIYITENKTDPMIKRFGAAWTSYNWEQNLMGKRVRIKFTREVGTTYTVFIDRKSTSYPLLLVGVNVDEGFAGIVEYVDIEEWNMQVKLKSELELLRSYFKHLPDSSPVNEATVKILKAVSGSTMRVDTHYLYADEFNLVVAAPDRQVLRIQADAVEEVIDDARPNVAKCKKCGYIQRKSNSSCVECGGELTIYEPTDGVQGKWVEKCLKLDPNTLCYTSGAWVRPMFEGGKWWWVVDRFDDSSQDPFGRDISLNSQADTITELINKE